MHLEIISRKSKKNVSASKSGQPRPNIVFVHGICVGAWIWDEYFLQYFADHGYDVHALSLRGHGKSDGENGLLMWSLADYANDLDNVVESLDGPVIVVGHSMGGAVVQDWLRMGRSREKAVGAALLASVPPWGLVYSAVRMGLYSPHLFGEISRMLVTGTEQINKEAMREALFSESTSDEIVNKFLDNLSNESLVASAEVQGLRPFAPLPWMNSLPMFVGGAVDDCFIPNFEVNRTASYYGVDAVMVKDLAHSIMIDKNWEEMAKPLLSWADKL